MSTVELAIDGELPAQPLGGLLRENVEADGIRVLLFSDAPQGLAAAQLLRSHAPRLRIGIDRPGRAALPLLDAANDGQTLVTKDIAATMLAEPGVAVCDLGIHRLEGVPSQRIVQLDFGSRCATFPSLRTLESVSHNLPASIKPLFGRRRELHEIVDALGTSRMVTLTGPGGIGKSRLLVATAARVARDFCDGVRLVYLADAFDLPAIVSTVGRAFEIGGVTDVYELIERSQLAIRSILLALDNCEHVVEACSALGRVLLERCPHVAIVASSREPLRIEGEAIYRVTPLDADSALSLFVNRMRNAGERAPTDPGDLQAIASVCEAVDRLPLAIECAAGGVVSLTLPQLAAPSLADRLGALRNRVTSDPRHLSLNATIDWSYTALTPRQRDAFLALALFAEPATLDAVVAVSGTTRDDVETLVHTSMAVAHEDTEKRFGMLETMRRFAFDRLEASASANALYDRYVERHRAAVPADYEPLPSETRNFEAALRYAVARNHTGAMLPLAFQLARTWLLQGTPLPAQATLAPLVVDDRLAAVDAALFARLLNTMAALASHVNDENRAASYAMRGLELRRRTNDPRLSESFVALGNLAMHRNELHEARRLFEEALRYEQGESTVQAANAMWNLAIVALGEHEFKTAERFMLDARKRFAATGNTHYEAWSLTSMGALYVEAERYARTFELYARALELALPGDDSVDKADLTINCGDLHARLGDFAAATLFYEVGCAMALSVGYTYGIVCAFEGLAPIFARGQQWRAAAKLLAAAKRLRGKREFISEPSLCKRREEVYRLVQARLGDDFAAACEEGERVAFDRLSSLAAEAPLALTDLQSLYATQHPWPDLPVALLQRFPKLAVAARALDTEGGRAILQRDLAADRTIGDTICRAVAARVLHEYGHTDEALRYARGVTEALAPQRQSLAHWLEDEIGLLTRRASGTQTERSDEPSVEGWVQWPRNAAIAAIRAARTVKDPALAHHEVRLALDFANACGDPLVRAAAARTEDEIASARRGDVPPRPTVRVNVLSDLVVRHGERVELSEREYEFLVALGMHEAPVRRDTIMAMLWPDLAGRDASNALKATVYRLRTRLADPAVVRIVGGAYSLGDGVAVDVREYVADSTTLLAKVRRTNDERRFLRTIFAAFAAGHWPTSARWEWFAPFEIELAHLERRIGVAAANDALATGDTADALAIASALLRRNPVDEAAMEIQLIAHGKRGESALAAQALRAFRRFYYNELGAEVPEHLEHLVDEA